MAPQSFLLPPELDLLTDTWAIWAEEDLTQGRKLARLRMHLFFLLARFGGLRPLEINAFNKADLDLAAGLLQTAGRRVFLPAQALRHFRRILTLPEADNPDFLRLDSGFLRRTFYAVAALANLPPALCAPRALRYARAFELFSMRMPVDLVAKSLGFKNAPALARLLQQRNIISNRLDSQHNCLAALVKEIATGGSAVRLCCEITLDLQLYCICSLSDMLTVEPMPGRTVTLYIPPAMLLPASSFPGYVNCLDCQLISVATDHLETRLVLSLAGHVRLTAVYDTSNPYFRNLHSGDKITFHVPPHAIQLR